MTAYFLEHHLKFYSQHGFIQSKEIREEWFEDTKIVDIKMIESALH